MIKPRYLRQSITQDLKEKMVFIAGPRQVGKTTLAKIIAEQNFSHSTYFNWDHRGDRKNILDGTFPAASKIVIFDELHKYRGWKNYIKGIFDTYKDQFSILVTGSARLDIYRKGGDSLLGRYHSYRLHPFSLAEIVSKETLHDEIFRELSFPKSKKTKEAFDALFKFGGFPEPLFHQTEKALRRWQNERVDRLIKEDIRDIEFVRDMSALQVLVELLLERAGGRLSLNSISTDLNVNHKTASLWVDILERFYYHFRIYPFSFHTIKSLRKEPKLYLWDWSPIGDEGHKFENMVASHLLKFIHFLCDAEGHKAELFYLRDREGREVDFLVTINKKPWFAVEAKLSEKTPSKHLHYFKERLKIPFVYQVVALPHIDILQSGIRVMSANQFFMGLI